EGSGAKIAIVDTGVQSNHPDLAGKVVGGWDFVDNDSTPQDGNGHGTHCAGIAAAVTNNSTGIAGTAPKA
ncbi:thermitase, partial [Thermoactinomyces vulgaris]